MAAGQGDMFFFLMKEGWPTGDFLVTSASAGESSCTAGRGRSWAPMGAGGRGSKAEAPARSGGCPACSGSLLKSVMVLVPGAFHGLGSSQPFFPGLPYLKFFCVT